MINSRVKTPKFTEKLISIFHARDYLLVTFLKQTYYKVPRGDTLPDLEDCLSLINAPITCLPSPPRGGGGGSNLEGKKEGRKEGQT